MPTWHGSLTTRACRLCCRAHLKPVSLMAPLYRLRCHSHQESGSAGRQMREAKSQSDSFLCPAMNLQARARAGQLLVNCKRV